MVAVYERIDAVRQLELFTRTETRAMRDRTRRRNYSPAHDEFRDAHERHRAWGLVQRHARKLRRIRYQISDCRTPGPPTSPRGDVTVDHDTPPQPPPVGADCPTGQDAARSARPPTQDGGPISEMSTTEASGSARAPATSEQAPRSRHRQGPQAASPHQKARTAAGLTNKYLITTGMKKHNGPAPPGEKRRRCRVG
ncbi:hypothetical protein Psuf_071890 [Phytohabitans suffuscus]|uniref:Uncharacterized protein n=1 Tax=Phytohabitans suffuscus TaxID=624315 RepID=A0A6F8YUZ5_9ACTN|nr:hypothetical protein Psuf_071890 [Phytohabitans suffuscus]